MNEILLRECGLAEWLGIWIIDGTEQYRTGRHYSTSFGALEQVRKMIEAGN